MDPEGRRRARPEPRPLAVAVGGRIASGKSTIARQVAREIGATLLVADRIREGAVAELGRETSPFEARIRGLERSVDAAVYAELLRRAGDELRAGRSVVLDAAFPGRAIRSEARSLAACHGAVFRLVECRASSPAVRARLADRAASSRIPLERWLALCGDFDAQFEAPDELPAAEHLPLDTSGSAAESAAAAVAWLSAARGG